MTQPPICPKCAHTLTFESRDARYVCPECGYQRYETLAEAQERMKPQLAAMQDAVSTLRVHQGTVNTRAATLFEDGRAEAARGDIADAIWCFERAIEIQPDFIDAHLAIARLVDDPKRKRSYLETALAHAPDNAEALRALMVIDGRLTADEAERTRTSGEIVIKHIDTPVKSSTRRLSCPVCGGNLTADETGERVFCKFCGYQTALSEHEAGAESFSMAMLERKGKGRAIWQIGERIIHCHQCGADRTIAASQLSMLCPFCGSNHVIETDAFGSFERPDGLISFTISEAQAQAIIRDKLKGIDQRLAGLFGDNRIASARLTGVYLPFWMFDAMVNVTQTIEDKRDIGDFGRRIGNMPVVQTHHLQDGELGLLVSAVKSTPHRLIDAVDDYNVSEMRGYDPALLARYPAELYAIDYADAALNAQGRIGATMRARYGRSRSEDFQIHVTSFPSSMTFSLVLLPMWIGTLIERDGDARMVLVNGQTGTAVLGKAEKRK